MRHDHPMNTRDTLLTLGATMRLTRLVTSDDLGQWYIQGPVYAQIQQRVPEQHRTYAHNLAGGLECPHCVGYWIGVGVLTTTLATKGTRLERPWRWLMAGLTLNAVTASLGKAIDYWG